jgi:hypothetical protein
MKKIFWQSIIVITVILGGFYFFKMEKAIAPEVQNNSSDLISYTDPTGAISFNYNKEFSVKNGLNTSTNDWRLDSQMPGTILATLWVPRSYMPRTNFNEAKIVFGRSNDPVAISSCLNADTNAMEKSEGEVTLSGKSFKKFTEKDAAAGNFYETTSYRGILDGDCYSILYTIHSGNIGNYSPDQGVKEFDLAKIQSELEKVVQSFKFLVNSD